MRKSKVPEEFLDFYEVEGGRTMWCWKRGEYSSQEFKSEKAALEAWRKGDLKWSRLED